MLLGVVQRKVSPIVSTLYIGKTPIAEYSTAQPAEQAGFVRGRRDVADAAAIAVMWGAEKGSLIYKDFMKLEPSGTQSDNVIDINDLQFVFGRFGNDCGDPHPDQDPVNPKA